MLNLRYREGGVISALFIKFNFGEFEAKDQREGGRERGSLFWCW